MAGRGIARCQEKTVTQTPRRIGLTLLLFAAFAAMWTSSLLASTAGAATITYLTDDRADQQPNSTREYPATPFGPFAAGGTFESGRFEGIAAAGVGSYDGTGTGIDRQWFDITFSVDEPVLVDVAFNGSVYFERVSLLLTSQAENGTISEVVPSLCVSSWETGCVEPNANYDQIIREHRVLLEPSLTYRASITAQASDWALGSSSFGQIKLQLVPEPGTAVLVGIGIGVLALRSPQRRDGNAPSE